jgi:hypothetical protein
LSSGYGATNQPTDRTASPPSGAVDELRRSICLCVADAASEQFGDVGA